MNILVTGGAGYIGSHTLIELMAVGHSVVVVNNLSNSNPKSLCRVESITGQVVPFIRWIFATGRAWARCLNCTSLTAAFTLPD